MDNQTKTALITGVTGQDGSYLAELLLSKGYQVHGIVRRVSLFNTARIDHLHTGENPNPSFYLHYGDLSDAGSLRNLLDEVEPDEVYNLAAQSHVKVSFDIPDYTTDVTAVGAVRLLEAIRSAGIKTRFYQASSSEMFGKVRETPQTEDTPFHPRSPYACAKVFAHWITVNFREAYGLHGCSGILFNHESPLRGETFVTRKITMAVARIARGQQECLYLGNLDARRDWGHARDYVDGMWRMLQQLEPDDYVLATGVTTSVREFTTKAFSAVGIELEWDGEGVDECGRDMRSGTVRIRVDPEYFRPTEVDLFLGDASKAKAVLGWEPVSDLDQLVEEMVRADLESL